MEIRPPLIKLIPCLLFLLLPALLTCGLARAGKDHFTWGWVDGNTVRVHGKTERSEGSAREGDRGKTRAENSRAAVIIARLDLVTHLTAEDCPNTPCYANEDEFIRLKRRLKDYLEDKKTRVIEERYDERDDCSVVIEVSHPGLRKNVHRMIRAAKER